jgi:hypothetical protein
MARHPRNYLKVLLWLCQQEIGTRFMSNGLGHLLNLTSGDVAHYVRMADCTKKAGKSTNNSTTIYEVTHTIPRPECPKNMCKVDGRKL